MTLDIRDDEFLIQDPNSLWKGNSLYSLYQKAHTPWDWHQPIFEKCRELGMIGFSAPFDATAVDFLESLDVPCYKISSFENTDLPLVRKAASTGKPLIISTGMATVAELDETVSTARNAGCEDLILLKCTSTYPASPEDSNIITIPHMRDTFNVNVGLSDHTLGLGVAIASVALGSTVIEKHFTLSRNDGGVDSAFSIEPQELRQLVTETERASQAIGHIKYGVNEEEKRSLTYRRSLYITEEIKAGECLTAKNLRAIRPGYGLPPKYMDLLLGRIVNKDVKKGTPMSWDIL